MSDRIELQNPDPVHRWLQRIGWRCVKCTIHHERDVRAE